jgi:hypothetical protein
MHHTHSHSMACEHQQTIERLPPQPRLPASDSSPHYLLHRSSIHFAIRLIIIKCRWNKSSRQSWPHVVIRIRRRRRHLKSRATHHTTHQKVNNTQISSPAARPATGFFDYHAFSMFPIPKTGHPNGSVQWAPPN